VFFLNTNISRNNFKDCIFEFKLNTAVQAFMYYIAYCRVEGEGRAIITDVIYQSKTSHVDKTTGDKKQYDKLQDEIKELVEKEKHLSFKLSVIKKQKTLLNKFAEQICQFSDSKVS